MMAGIAGIVMMFSMQSFRNPQLPGGSTWEAPASANAIKNPYAADEAAAAVTGKKIFTQYCVACHGNSGKGDGIAAVSLNPRPADFLLTPIVKESDGALFWKMTNGKSPMPAWGSILKPEQRWQIVCYIRQIEEKYAKVKPAQFTGTK